MTQHARFLGFAFANADFLFEVDAQGKIVFCAGAVADLANGAMPGAAATALFDPAFAGTFNHLLKTLPTGERRGPLLCRLKAGSNASLSMFRLAENDAHVSCTLSRGPGELKKRDAATGLETRDGLLDAAAQATESDALALVNIPGLSDAINRLGKDKSDHLLKRIGTALSGMGKAAGRISETRFGVIADAVGGSKRLGQTVRAVLKEGGAGTLAIEETLVSLKGKNLSDGQRTLVARYVVDQFASGKLKGGDVNAADVFGQMMDDTQKRLQKLTDTVAEGRFTLAYQPIVTLKSGDVSHFEALTRFDNGSPGETIKFAEELGISDAFDLAVAMKVIAVVEGGTSFGQDIAFNVCGHTICRPANFGLLAGLLARKRALSKRLLIEITETAEITDFEAAKKAIGALRAMGFRVGLDDFGAGAASINYLQAFTVDFVKFDGSLIRNIGRSERDDRMLSGLVRMCADLGVATVAEFLETEAQVATARAMGFDKGQGHYFGAATALVPPPLVKTAAKRKGIQESWR
ncbi:MAG: EAL domain-containing protein [Alphaproteobacteria bacterium]|nr:EAL domain-containing protein [Alphaproteobacteria bacterium]MBL7097667.1 EAL domain-containing protein [Alphaproteobacteria bacterium]